MNILIDYDKLDKLIEKNFTFNEHKTIMELVETSEKNYQTTEELFLCLKCGSICDVSDDLEIQDNLYICHTCVADYLKEVLGSLD